MSANGFNAWKLNIYFDEVSIFLNINTKINLVDFEIKFLFNDVAHKYIISILIKEEVTLFTSLSSE